MTVSNKTTLVDNATWNWTQISRAASMFMSNETEAVKILKKYDATYVVIFVTFYYDGVDWDGVTKPSGNGWRASQI